MDHVTTSTTENTKIYSWELDVIANVFGEQAVIQESMIDVLRDMILSRPAIV